MLEARGRKSEAGRLSPDCADDGVRHPEHGRTFTTRAIGRRGSGRTPVVWLALALLVGICVVQPVRAGDLTPQASGSKYYVWGQVHSPGAYSFLAAPDIFELVSAAGGPTENANLTHIILIRAVAQTRTRVNLQAVLNKGQVVRLSPGDVVIVPSSSWYRFTQGLSVFTTIVSTLTLVITVAAWFRG
jgi:protein involved in polysaccharide export with SLBB domain